MGGAGKLRIVAGAFRGRSIAAPADDAIRPTSDRVREALFNRLTHGFGDHGFRLIGARVADICAGTGALGLEALSRGAAGCVFVEQDGAALALIRRNVAALGVEDRATVLMADAAHLPRASAPCDLVLMDPPYAAGIAAAALTSLAAQGWLAPGALVAVETAADAPALAAADFTALDRRPYGRAAVTILKYHPNK